jgi:hypothetical protein
MIVCVCNTQQIKDKKKNKTVKKCFFFVDDHKVTTKQQKKKIYTLDSMVLRTNVSTAANHPRCSKSGEKPSSEKGQVCCDGLQRNKQFGRCVEPKNRSKFSISDYCKNPELYPNVQGNKRTYYDNFCKKRNYFKKKWRSFSNKFFNKGEGWKYGDFIIRMLFGMLTPEGLETLSIGILTPISLGMFTEKLITSLKSRMKRTPESKSNEPNGDDVSPGESEVTEQDAETADVAAETADVGLEDALEEGSIEAIDEVVMEATITASTEMALESAALMTLCAFNGLLSAVMITQLIGMVLDLWDPNHYGVVLNAKTLSLFSQKFNEVFDETILNNHRMYDANGIPMSIVSVPREFYADSNFMKKMKMDTASKKMYLDCTLRYRKANFNAVGFNVTDVENNASFLNNETFSSITSTLENIQSPNGGVQTKRNGFFAKIWESFAPFCIGMLISLFILLMFIA